MVAFWKIADIEIDVLATGLVFGLVFAILLNLN